MAKPNHHSLAYKMRANPNKTYKELKQKQRVKISEWMFRAVCEYYREHGEMPGEDASSEIVAAVYEKIKSVAIWVPYDEVSRAFLSKLARYEARIAENGIPEETPKKKKSPTVPQKKGRSKKVCPSCGRKMKCQFNGLQHCKCGVSWKKGEGFFERTSDMVFALEGRKIGKKIKQCPVIRCRNAESDIP